jgi:hypothetical protein
MKELQIGQAVKIHWVDSAVTPGWRPVRSLDPAPLHVISLGYVVAFNDTAVTISHSISVEKDCIAPITIPNGCVEKVDELQGAATTRIFAGAESS